MNKRILLIVVILLIILIVGYAINSKKEKQPNNSSGETTVYIEDIDFDSLDISDRFKEVVKHIYSNHNFNKEDIKTKDELKEEFGLESIGEFDGILIKDPEPFDYKEIAIIAPNDTTNNDALILSMINNYEKIKSNNPDASYLRDSNNINIKTQGGIAIFIISKEASQIYHTIMESDF